jgi:Cu2+-exporting ATPase
MDVCTSLEISYYLEFKYVYLIGIGAGVAFCKSLDFFFQMSFRPSLKPKWEQFICIWGNNSDFNLVLLGQLLEAKAHSKTSGAIKELLKLAYWGNFSDDGKDKVISIHDINKETYE